MSEVGKSPLGIYEESELARYEWLSDYEKTLQLFVDETREFASLLHETEDTAYQMSALLVGEWAEELRAADEYGVYPTLALQGEGIFVPNVTLKKTPNGFLIESDIEAPIRPLAVGESKKGSISGIYPVVVSRSDGMFHADVQMTFRLDSPLTIATIIPQLPQPIYGGQIESRGFSLLSGDVFLQSAEKQEFDRQFSTDIALAKSGLLRSQLVQNIDMLAQQMAALESQDYRPLEDINLLKHIARECVEYAKRGACSEVALADKLMQVFKKGMPLMLADTDNGRVGAGGEIQGGQEGFVEEVFFKYDEYDRPKSLCIGLASQDDNDTPVTSFYEIDKLIALHL